MLDQDLEAIRRNSISNDEIKRRYLLSYEAKSEFDSMLDKFDHEFYAFEKHINMDEVWDDETYRFPELFGVLVRKYSNLLEVLPECKVRSSTEAALALQMAIDSEKNKSNIERVKYEALWDAMYSGYGWMFVVPTEHYKNVRVDGKIKKALAYRGLTSECIDPRDIIPAYSSTQLHDHTGMNQCPYLFRRRIYYFDSFLAAYKDLEGYNQEVIDQILPTSFEGNFVQDSRIMTQHEAQQQDQGTDYVIVMEYWDSVNDVFRVFANGWENEIYDSPNGIPYSHKQLPFHVYYNYKRRDSIMGISELALNLPYVQFKEQIQNLEIDNIRLELQPAYIVDGMVNFNEEEHELKPGAIFNLKGMLDGKLADHIMPFRVGGVTADVPNVISQIESSQIAVTGDDFKSLYANPNQLATQTLSKREALLKRTRTNVAENMRWSEYYLHLQLASYIKNELSQPFKNAEGKTEYQKILVQGFDVDQPRPDAKLRGVKQRDGAESKFYLNKKVTATFDMDEIEVVPSSIDEQLKRDRIEKLILFMQEVFKLVQTPQGQALLQGMDVNNFIKQVGLQLGLDTAELLPNVVTDEMPSSIENSEYDMIAKGEVPPVQQDKYNPVQRYLGTLEFSKTNTYKNLAGASKAAFQEFQSNLLNNVKSQTSTPLPTEQAPNGAAEGLSVQPPQGSPM